jgi:hypothetical protein
MFENLNKKFIDEYGYEIHLISEQEMRTLAEEILGQLEKVPNNLNLLKNVIEDKGDKFYQIFAALFAYSNYFLNTQGTKPIKEYYHDELKKGLELETKYPLFKTEILQYRHSLFEIINRIATKKKTNEINKFVKSISDENIITLKQQTARVYVLTSELDITSTDIPTDDLDKYLDLYDECAGSIETYIKIIYGIEQIIDNKNINFEKIINTNTYKIKSELKQIDTNYGVLLGPFNTNIWNSIKHKKVQRIPTIKEIKFKYDSGTIQIKYSEFFRQSQIIYLLLILLSNFLVALELKLQRKI